MSRIHEALRRAEQERAANQSAQRVEESGERSAATGLIDAAPPPIALNFRQCRPNLFTAGNCFLRNPRPKFIPDALQFEEIWANCSRAQVEAGSNGFSCLVIPILFIRGRSSFGPCGPGLYRIRDSQPLNTVLISSAIPAEGKTLVATNLAHALVRQQGCRVLLIDADLLNLPRTSHSCWEPPRLRDWPTICKMAAAN